MDLIDLENLCNQIANQYFETLSNRGKSFSLDYLDLSKFKLFQSITTSNSNVFIWLQQEAEYTRHLINLLNTFRARLNRLSILEELINIYDLSNEDQNTIRYEFTEVLLYYCLHQPSEYANRVKYMCTHLCHQANLAIDSNYDEKSFKTNDWEKYSKNWQTVNPLIKSLKYIGSHSIDFDDITKTEYTTKTYRNKSQHEIPRSIDWGITNLVDRNKSNGIIHYQMGGFESIKTENVISTLIIDSKAMRDTFLCYWDLVNEQNEAFISAKYLSNEQ